MSLTVAIPVAVAIELVLSWIVPRAGLLVVLTVVGAATRLVDHPTPAPARVTAPLRPGRPGKDL